MALDPALLAQIKNAKNKYSRSSKSVKLKEGKTTVRLVGLPGQKFWAENGVHWIKTEKNGKPVAVTGCNDEVHQQPCAVCAAIDAASKSASDDETLAIIKEWKMKKTVLVNALIRSGSDASEDPQVVELTPTAFGQMLSTIEEYQASDVDILDHANGVDFIVERVGKGFDTEYRVMVAPKSKPVPASAIEKLVDLDAYIEKEFFRGDERKALTAIANMTGISVSSNTGIEAPTRAGLLTGPAGAVDDAIVEEEIAEALELVEAPATSPDDELAIAEAEAEAAAAAAMAKVTALKAKAAAKAAVKPDAVKPATTKVVVAAKPQEDIDAMLADLDGLTA